MKTARQITIYDCVCERCGFEWVANVEDPKRCASCRTPYWNVPKGLRRQNSWAALAQELGVSRQRVNQMLNPEKQNARHKVYYAIKAGVLDKPSACTSCGDSTVQIEAHHDDYSKPLDVEWLCSTCHGKRHRKN